MMTQLLVPMTYAEKLEQELIQVESERKMLKSALKGMVEWSCFRTDYAENGMAGQEPDDHPLTIARKAYGNSAR